MAVLLETNVGDIVIDLFVKEKPVTCKNFLKLCKIKYYNFSLFYNVQPYFIAQAGDPTNTGQGGRAVYGMCRGKQTDSFPKEESLALKHTKAGTLSMVADARDGSHRSQFILTLAPYLVRLDGEHSPFGVVTEGLDVLLKLNETLLDDRNRPLKDYRINHTIVLDDPFDDLPGLQVPDLSPSEPSAEQQESFRIGAEEVDESTALTKEQAEEQLKEKEASAQAQILELVGDLPSADVKPPENVLFVCKLNAVTSDEDLKLIFSRFGSIVECHVVRDPKTDDSLQYAFIEFERVEDCEKAYLKMENVLIDDRRIHVDFSQSVAKQSKTSSWFKQYFQRKRPAVADEMRSRSSTAKSDVRHSVYKSKDADYEKDKKRLHPTSAANRHDAGRYHASRAERSSRSNRRSDDSSRQRKRSRSLEKNNHSDKHKRRHLPSERDRRSPYKSGSREYKSSRH